MCWLATQCTPSPALLKFPANREFNREFCKIVASGALRDPNLLRRRKALKRIPYLTEQGIILTEQGILDCTPGVNRD